MAILLVIIIGYSIGGYFISGSCWLFYWWLLVPFYRWLLVVILLAAIGGYSIGGYWCLFINGYRWLFY